MPLLLWLNTIFSGLISYFLDFMTKRFAVLAAVITSFLAVLAILTATFQALLNGLVSITPSGAFLFGLGLLPGNTETVLATYISGRLAAMVYSYRLQMLDFNSRAMLIR